MPRLISLEPHWYMLWSDACDAPASPAWTKEQAWMYLVRHLSFQMDGDLALEQARRTMRRIIRNRREERAAVSRFNRAGPREGKLKLEQIIADSHPEVQREDR